MSLHKPRRELLLIWRLYLILCALIPAFLLSLFCAMFGTLWLILTAAWLVIFLTLFSFYFPLAFRNRAFSVGKDHITAYGGVVYRYSHSLPIANLQYLTLMSSPLERLFHICSLVVVAPGGRMVISGLRRVDGKNLVAILTEASIQTKSGL